MTMITDLHTAPAASRESESASDRMPHSLRWTLALALAGVLTFALYLVAVRGEALLLDLATLGRGLWCF